MKLGALIARTLIAAAIAGGLAYAGEAPKIASAPMTVTAILLDGGGVDDAFVTFIYDNTEVMAYCDRRCGRILIEPEEEQPFTVRKSAIGKAIKVAFANESNNDRIAGSDRDEILTFVKKIKLLRK